MNTKLASYLNEKGASVNVNGKRAEVTLSIHSLNKLIGTESAVKAMTSHFSIASNAHRASDVLNNDKSDRVEFCGGDLSQLKESIEKGADLTKAREALKRFQASDLSKRLAEVTLDLKPKRRFRTSDSDGDFDYMRRFDSKPLIDSYRAKVIQRIVTLDCHFNFLSQVSAESIARYGAFAWSVCQLLEDAGFQVEVNSIIESKDSSYSSKAPNSRITVNVKKAGQYMAPATLAACFTPNFFRRYMFAMIVTSADFVLSEVALGLGSASTFPSPVQFNGSALVLSGNAHEGATDQIVNEILKSINGK